MLVHFGGQPCEMEKIMPWAKKETCRYRGLRRNLEDTIKIKN